MPQPLPKTDSRDLELAVLGPQDSSAPGSVAVWLRFWTKGERGFEAVRVSLHSDGVLLQMVSDLVIADGGKLEPEPPYALVASFHTPVQAVRVAKRIHRCVSALAAEANVSVSAGVAICTLHTGVSAVRTLLEAALPGTVVVPEDISRQLEAVP